MKLGRWNSEKDTRAYIIADVGANHCNDLDQAIAHIRTAAECGVDCVKFQFYRAHSIYPPEGTAEYLGNRSLHSILKQYELPQHWLPELKKQCDGYGVDFACTPFDLDAVDLLDPYVSFWKIASFELNWHHLLQKCKYTRRSIILSSGGATFPEIAEAVKVASMTCSYENSNVALLHCISQYPADLTKTNLRVIPHWIHGGQDGESGYHYSDLWNYIKEKTGKLDIQYTLMYASPEIYGLSDHTEHPSLAPCAAVTLGARIIEKHFTLHKDLPSPDASFALDPKQLKQMVEDIRMTEKMLGSSEKKPQPGELSSYKRTLYATEDLSVGTMLTEKNTACLRNVGKPNPAPPQALGCVLRHTVAVGQMISTEDLE